MVSKRITQELGVFLSNGCRIAHGQSTNVKKPFSNIAVLMHEVDRGTPRGQGRSYCGQFGFIPFDESLRLPRHVHITASDDLPILVTERILVLQGVAMTELNGHVYVIAPGSFVTIAAGVPHTWTACPVGVTLPDGLKSNGKFMMVYEYEEPTGFFPTRSIETLGSVAEYQKFEGDIEDIRFPLMTKEDVVEKASLVWNHEVRRLCSEKNSRLVR